MRIARTIGVVAGVGMLAGMSGARAGGSRLMIVDSGAGDRVMLFDGDTGALVDANWLTDIGAVGWAFTTPKEARVVGGEIWVSDQVTDGIHRFDMSRVFLGSVTAHPAGGTLDNLRGFGFDGTTVYQTVFHGTTALRGVAKFDTAGTPMGFFPGNTTSASFFDAEPFMGDLLVSNSVSDALERWTTGGVFVGNFATGIVDPQQVIVLADNSVIAASTISTPGIEGVYHLNADGTLRRYIDTEGLKQTFGEIVPRAAWVLGDGDYLIAGSSGVYKYSVAGNSFSQIAGGVDAQYIAPLTTACPASACPIDTNGDGVINFADLNNILSTFGQVCPVTGCTGDLCAIDTNGDGVINFGDLNNILSTFGQMCATR